MRVALHWSLCRDDALDAYQRALEIYVRRLESLDPATEVAWLKVVVKHEALAVRRQRTDALQVENFDLDGHAAAAERPVDDLLAGRERIRRSAEALRRIKPDEARALVLKGQGLSYREIGESLGWTYTKVNRALTEGRARFLKVYGEIEAGEECERFAPTLAAIAGGTASADALLELRPHIRNCATCRATVRELHATRVGRLAALWPIPALLAPVRWVAGRFGDATQPATVREPPEASAAVVVPDLYAAVASREAALLSAVDPARPRFAESALQRAGDGVASLKQYAASGYARAVDVTPLAGARPGAAAAAIAGCIAIGSGTTYCVTEGVDPIGGLAQVVAPAREHKPAAPREKRAVHKRPAVASSQSPVPVAIATPVPRPPEPSPQPDAQPTTQPTPAPTSPPAPPPTPQEEYEPVAPAVAASNSQQSQPRASSTPAPAPAGGPGEFDGP
jgi:RNA polymerase sigma factor (sigma-70 family)